MRGCHLDAWNQSFLIFGQRLTFHAKTPYVGNPCFPLSSYRSTHAWRARRSGINPLSRECLPPSEKYFRAYF